MFDVEDVHLDFSGQPLAATDLKPLGMTWGWSPLWRLGGRFLGRPSRDFEDRGVPQSLHAIALGSSRLCQNL